MTRVFLSGRYAVLTLGRGKDRDDAVRSALAELQRITRIERDFGEFRTCGFFPLWDANPLAFIAHENDASEVPDDAFLDVIDEHGSSERFVVLIKSGFHKYPHAL